MRMEIKEYIKKAVKHTGRITEASARYVQNTGEKG